MDKGAAPHRIPGNEEADRLAEEGVKCHGVPLKPETAEKAGVKRKETRNEATGAKRARRGAGEQHQRTGWFLVTEPDIRQQRLKVKQRIILQEEIIQQIHKSQYTHILAVASLQYDLSTAQ